MTATLHGVTRRYRVTNPARRLMGLLPAHGVSTRAFSGGCKICKFSIIEAPSATRRNSLQSVARRLSFLGVRTGTNQGRPSFFFYGRGNDAQPVAHGRAHLGISQHATRALACQPCQLPARVSVYKVYTLGCSTRPTRPRHFETPSPRPRVVAHPLLVAFKPLLPLALGAFKVLTGRLAGSVAGQQSRARRAVFLCLCSCVFL